MNDETTPGSHRARATAMLERLRSEFPRAFTKPRPLAVGIKAAIVERLGLTAEADMRALSAALASWCMAPRYLARIKTGAQRVDLKGRRAGEVTPAEADAARQRLADFVKRHKKPARRPTDKPKPPAAKAPAVPVTVRKKRRTPIPPPNAAA